LIENVTMVREKCDRVFVREVGCIERVRNFLFKPFFCDYNCKEARDECEM